LPDYLSDKNQAILKAKFDQELAENNKKALGKGFKSVEEEVLQIKSKAAEAEAAVAKEAAAKAAK